MHVTNRFDNIFEMFVRINKTVFVLGFEKIDGHFILSLGHYELKEVAHFAIKLIFSPVRDDSLYL